MKLKYNHKGETREIPLSTYKPAGKRLAVRKNGQVWYSPLVPADDPSASNIKANFGGNVHALKTAFEEYSTDIPYLDYLVCYLPFNNSVSEDFCGNRWTAYGSPTIGADNAVRDNALQLPGDSSTYLECKDISLGGKDFTVSAWIYPTKISNYAFCRAFSIFSSVPTIPAYGGRPNSDSCNRIFVDATKLCCEESSFGSVVQNKLQHVAFVYQHSAGLVSCFLDGVLVGALNATYQVGTLDRIWINKAEWSPAPSGVSVNQWSGSIDEFQIYDGIAIWTENFTPPTSEDYNFNFPPRIHRVQVEPATITPYPNESATGVIYAFKSPATRPSYQLRNAPSWVTNVNDTIYVSPTDPNAEATVDVIVRDTRTTAQATTSFVAKADEKLMDIILIPDVSSMAVKDTVTADVRVVTSKGVLPTSANYLVNGRLNNATYAVKRKWITATDYETVSGGYCKWKKIQFAPPLANATLTGYDYEGKFVIMGDNNYSLEASYNGQSLTKAFNMTVNKAESVVTLTPASTDVATSTTVTTKKITVSAPTKNDNSEIGAKTSITASGYVPKGATVTTESKNRWRSLAIKIPKKTPTIAGSAITLSVSHTENKYYNAGVPAVYTINNVDVSNAESISVTLNEFYAP